MPAVIRVEHLYKKFRRGDYHASLRELLPALARKAVTRAKNDGLERQEFWALRDVDFAIEQGDTVGIIGHNGAGKSTMLKHLTGVLQPTAGTITTHGRVSALIEVAAGFHPMLTGRENVFLNGVILGMSIQEIHRKFDEIVDFSGLEEFIDTPVRRYSSGMHARLGFSVAAHLDPEILLIDEVLSVGDYAFQHKGIEKMKSIAASGATVMFVSHSLRAIQQLCRRCLLLDHGRLIMDGLTEDVTKGYLDAGRAKLTATPDANAPASVERVEIHNASGVPAVVLETSERFTIEGTVQIRRDCPESDIFIGMYDHARVQAVNLSLRRLGWGHGQLLAGQRITFKVSADANFVAGGYELLVAVRDNARGRDIATLDPPLQFMVQSDAGSRGIVHIQPELESVEVGDAAASGHAAPTALASPAT